MLSQASPIASILLDREQHVRLLESVAIHAHDAIMIAEAEPVHPPGPRILYVNPAFTAMTGYSLEEVVDKTPRLLQGPKTSRPERDRIRAALNTWQPVRGELLNYRKDGSEFWVELSIFPVADGTGKYTHWISIQRDCTERKRAEEMLSSDSKQAEERLRLALQGSGDFIWDYDPTAREMRMDPAFQHDVLGYAPEEVLPAASWWNRALAPEEAPAIIETFRACLEGKIPIYEVEHRALTRDGRWCWVLVRGKVIERDPQGQPLRMIGTVRDVTERRQREEEQRQMEARLQETQRLESLGVLAGGIAHDFNNLLAVILGNTSLAGREVLAGSPVRDFLRQIEAAACRAADLCRQMLAYAGKGRFVLQSLDLSQIVRDTTDLLQVSISKKATLSYRLAANLPAVQADATQMRQIIMNLMINASEALGDQDGRIDLATGYRPATERDPANPGLAPAAAPHGCVWLEVRDSGCGMDAQTIAHIFDPFFSTKFIGRGLGLSAVQGIVRGHHGVIQVESQPGQGAVFRVLLPALERSAGPAAAPAGRPAPTWPPGLTALVVDDEDPLREVAVRLLEASGVRTLEARNGLEALALFDAKPEAIHVVLLDLTMPRMDGAQTLAELHRRRPGLPVILMSGYGEPDLQERFAGRGFAGFLQKPFSSDNLIGKLNAALASPSKHTEEFV